jgi:TRAP-type C4-dicarboxylate transport system permease small subunit
MKKLGLLIATIVAGFFLSVVTAIMSARFWGWFEERTGIESLGHGGPATWVYLALWMFWTAILMAILFRTFRRANG